MSDVLFPSVMSCVYKHGVQREHEDSSRLVRLFLFSVLISTDWPSFETPSVCLTWSSISVPIKLTSCREVSLYQRICIANNQGTVWTKWLCGVCAADRLQFKIWKIKPFRLGV